MSRDVSPARSAARHGPPAERSGPAGSGSSTLPAPPDEMPARPPRVELAAGTLLVRVYRPVRGGWNEPRVWGPLARFDHHRPPPGSASDRAVWYAALSLAGAVAEAFGDLGLVDRDSDRRIVLARPRRPLAILDLLGAGPRVFGLDQRLATTTDYPRTQRWARGFYRAYPDVAGVRWRGRQSAATCVVLTDRVDLKRLERVADHPIGASAVWPRVARAARRLRLAIV